MPLNVFDMVAVFLVGHMATQLKTHFPASLAVRDGHITKFWPTGHEYICYMQILSHDLPPGLNTVEVVRATAATVDQEMENN